MGARGGFRGEKNQRITELQLALQQEFLSIVGVELGEELATSLSAFYEFSGPG